MTDIRQRRRHARELLRRGDWEAATREYLWLWDNMLAHDKALAGVRVSFLVGEMEELAASSDLARERFLALRDRYRPGVESLKCTRDEFADWVRLSRMLGDSAAVLDWFDTADRTSSTVVEHLVHNRRDFFELLVERGRWRDAGEFLDEPLQILDDEIQVLRDVIEREASRKTDHMRRAVEHVRSSVRDTASNLYRALLAADRGELAARVHERVDRALRSGGE